MGATEHPALHQAELLAGGQLALAGEAGKAGQVVNAASRPPYPIAGVHLTAALGALGAKPATRHGNIVESTLWYFDLRMQQLKYFSSYESSIG